jgi:hypothetical protein
MDLFIKQTLLHSIGQTYPYLLHYTRICDFNLLNPSNRSMSLGLTQPLEEMNTWNLPEGQRAASA